MRIIAIDDENPALYLVLDAINEVCPDAEVKGFNDPAELLEYAKDHPIDIAFLDIQIYEVLGTEVALQLKTLQPKINIIFVTAYSNYVSDAMRMHASGYIQKPVSPDDIRREIADLRYELPQQSEYLASAKCFGNFDFYKIDGTPVNFSRAKSKEILAYLICRRGASCNMNELGAILFEDESYDKKKKVYLQRIVFDLTKDLDHAGMSDLIRKSYNSISINPQKLKCDYYDYLNGDASLDRLYDGQFMDQYSWAEDYNNFWQDE